jgi:membrane-associated phospholipid phosphatase
VARSYLTIGLLSTLSFVVVTALVVSKVTQAADAQLAIAINHADPGAAFTALMVVAAEYGREYFWVPVVGVMLILGSRRTKLLAMELAVLFIVGIVMGEVLKFAVFRPRPFESIDMIITRVPTDVDSSYPSGHALIVTIGAAFSVLKFRKKIVALCFGIEAAIVCYSRVYVGVHYPLDVVGGIFLGIGIVGVGLFLVERYLGPVLTKITSMATKILKDGPLDL